MCPPEITEEEAEDQFQDAIREKFSSFSDVCHFFRPFKVTLLQNWLVMELHALLSSIIILLCQTVLLHFVPLRGVKCTYGSMLCQAFDQGGNFDTSGHVLALYYDLFGHFLGGE